MARKKSYVKTCPVCNNQFIATRSDAIFDTGACRARAAREKKDQLLESYQRLYINQMAAIALKEGESMIRMESLRNGLGGQIPPDEVKTDQYVFRKKDERFWSVELI